MMKTTDGYEVTVSDFRNGMNVTETSFVANGKTVKVFTYTEDLSSLDLADETVV